MGIFGKEKTIKEYSCGARKFYLYEVTKKRREKLDRNNQNQEAYLRNSNWAGFGGALAEMAAIMLTPEGDHPDKKNIAAVQEEIQGLPFRFVFEFLHDLHESGMARAEAKGDRRRIF